MEQFKLFVKCFGFKQSQKVQTKINDDIEEKYLRVNSARRERQMAELKATCL